MPRSNSFRSSSAKSSSVSKPRSSSYSTPATTPTTAHTSATVQQHSVKVEQPGFLSNMIQGFGLGAGQSLAFNLFRSNTTPTPAPAPAPTAHSVPANSSLETSLPKEFVKCMKETNNDTDSCKHYLE